MVPTDASQIKNRKAVDSNYNPLSFPRVPWYILRMQYYGPHRVYKDKEQTKLLGYVYAASVDNVPLVIGYCAGWESLEKEKFEQVLGKESPLTELSLVQAKQLEAFKHKFHTSLHATEEEACDCYREYCLDQSLILDNSNPAGQRRCISCGDWTDKYAQVEHSVFYLCEKHCTREEVEKYYKVGTRISSY